MGNQGIGVLVCPLLSLLAVQLSEQLSSQSSPLWSALAV
jgi:hypothetical protein